MQLAVRHQSIYRYPRPASRVALLLRLQPSIWDGQQPREWQVTVNDAPVPVFSANAYGDGEAHCTVTGPVSEVVIVAAGLVSTQDRHGIVAGLPPGPPPALFLRQTRLTLPDRSILDLAATVRGEVGIARLHALSARVRDQVAYRPGATSADSTAAEAMALGQGVCQDQAHIFVSAARALGVPARYVAGYLLVLEGGTAQSETHAWAEAWVPDLGWVGFDPTNGVCITEAYVRLCCGLDAHDATPVRGSVYGSEAGAIAVAVRIAEAGLDPGQAQQQQ